ncbi:MAG: hypothetical protein WB997_07535, partial [Candidatus Acidiferrales bacterium]
AKDLREKGAVRVVQQRVYGFFEDLGNKLFHPNNLQARVHRICATAPVRVVQQRSYGVSKVIAVSQMT